MTINVNGLRRKLTRQTVFRSIKKKKIDICFIQESFITDSVKLAFNEDWDGKMIYSPGTQHSLGNIILFDKSFEISNLDIIVKTERLLGVSFIHDNEK